MKKLILLVLVLAVAFGMSSYAFAAESIINASLSATVSGTFAVKFYPRSGIDATDAKIVFPTGAITFATRTITGLESMVYPDGRSASDGKSDIGVLCLSNDGALTKWGLKMKQTGNIPPDNLVMYIDGKALNRNAEGSPDIGGVQKAAGWYKVETSDMLMYLADTNHLLTMPWGTLMTFNFAIIPSGQYKVGDTQICSGLPLTSGPHAATIVFTMTSAV